MTAEQFVVFLDILGFKERVFRNSHNDIEKELRELNEDIIQLVNNCDGNQVARVENLEKGQAKRSIDDLDDTPIKLAQFSDSIVLFSNDVTGESLNRIAQVASQIMQSSLSKGYPLKGALAQGILTNDSKKHLFFGRALIDAYLLEEEIHYYGIAVHHSAEKSVQEYGNKNLFCDNTLFFKTGMIGHYEVCWYKDEKVSDSIGAYLNKIRFSVSGQPRKYIDNTLSLIQKENGDNNKTLNEK